MHEDGTLQEWKPVTVSQELQDSVKFLASSGMSQLLQEWLLETIFQDLSKWVGPAFWWKFKELGDDSAKNQSAFCCAFEYLYSKWRMCCWCFCSNRNWV
ncbi:uncharacterized protein LOC101845493 isoform X2 [Aplysia californica]|uniref:Uncharacterized protein LOC101845493 isoform X2 n=1 Tax=Aplysia californica TaxID=6500 RepID=A0ABM1A8S8_APLCA|nr:uncharacterized protein LOC101845493 isoform X2 [Aplysia californica]